MMKHNINRRRFVQASAVSLTMSSSKVFSNADSFLNPNEEKPNVPQFYKVLFDSRFSAANGFMTQAQESGYQVEIVGDDITSLWFNDLYSYWNNNAEQKPIMGMTTQSVAYCLEELARDVGLKVVFKAEHKLQNNEQPSYKVNSLNELDNKDGDWSKQAYSAALNYKENLASAVKSDYAPGITADHGDVLVSWVIT